MVTQKKVISISDLRAKFPRHVLDESGMTAALLRMHSWGELVYVGKTRLQLNKASTHTHAYTDDAYT